MPSLDQQILRLLNSRQGPSLRLGICELIETLPSFHQLSSLPDIEADTMLKLVRRFEDGSDSRSRNWMGMLILELLKYSPLALRRMQNLEDPSFLGEIILSVDMASIKLIAGSIMRFISRNGYSPSDFFPMPGADEFAADFPMLLTGKWIQDFQDYLDNLTDRDICEESCSVWILATAVLIDETHLHNNPNPYPMVVELLPLFVTPGVLTLTQVTVSSSPLFVEIPLENIISAQYRTRGSFPETKENSHLKYLPHIVLTLASQASQASNHLVNCKEKCATSIKIFPGWSDDAKGFLAELKLSLPSRHENNADVQPPSSDQKQQPTASTKSMPATASTAFSVALAKVDEEASTKSTSAPNKPGTIIKLRDQMRNEKGEADETRAIEHKASVSKHRAQSKLETTVKSLNKTTAEGKPSELGDDLFEPPTSPPSETKLQRSRGGTKSRKAETQSTRRRNAVSKLTHKASSSKKFRKSTTNRTPVKTRSATAKDLVEIISDKLVDMVDQEEKASIDEKCDDRNVIQVDAPSFNASTASTKRPPTAVSGNQHLASHSDIHHESTDSDKQQELLSDKSIRKPSIARFGPRGPINQGNVSGGRQKPLKDMTTPGLTGSRFDYGVFLDLFNAKKLDREESQKTDLENIVDRLSPPRSAMQQKIAKIRFEDAMLEDGAHCPSTSSLVAVAASRPRNDTSISQPGAIPGPDAKSLNSLPMASSVPNLSGWSKAKGGIASDSQIESSLQKRPREDGTSSIVQKRTKFDGQGTISRLWNCSNEKKSKVQQRSEAKNGRRGTQLSARVDIDGSPFPTGTFLPVDRVAIRTDKFELGGLAIAPPNIFKESRLLKCENMSPQITIARLELLFKQVGDVLWCRLEHDPITNALLGYVKMQTAAEAAGAVNFFTESAAHSKSTKVCLVDENFLSSPALRPLDAPFDSDTQMNEIHLNVAIDAEEGESADTAPFVISQPLPNPFMDESGEPKVPRLSPVPGKYPAMEVSWMPKKKSQSTQQAGEDIVESIEYDIMPERRSTVMSKDQASENKQVDKLASSDGEDSDKTIVVDKDDDEDTSDYGGNHDDGEGEYSIDEDISVYSGSRNLKKNIRAEQESSESDSTEVSSSTDDSDGVSTVDESSEDDEAEWEMALEPHQSNYADALISVFQRLLRHLVNKETAIEDIAADFGSGGKNLVTMLEESNMDDLAEMEEALEMTNGTVAAEFKAIANALTEDHQQATELGERLEAVCGSMTARTEDGRADQLDQLDWLLAQYGQEAA